MGSRRWLEVSGGQQRGWRAGAGSSQAPTNAYAVQAQHRTANLGNRQTWAKEMPQSSEEDTMHIVR